MTILVTGGAGFIGSHLCEVLLDKGENVVCVDDFNDSYNPKFKEENIKFCLRGKNFELFKVDITNIKDLKSVFQKNKIEKVVHLAARTGIRSSIENTLLYEKVNISGTLNTLVLAKKFNVKNFIFGSSSSVYGNSKSMPFSEDNSIGKPISPYAATKKAAEIMCYAYSSLYSIPITCLRFFSVYGPRGRPDMAPYKFTERIYKEKELQMFGDGASKRDYTYVTDIINGILAALNKEFKFEIINLGNSKPSELRYLISLVEKELGKKAKIKKMPLNSSEMNITYADIRKAKRLLKWIPKIKIEKGIKKFVEWYKTKRA